MTLGVSSILGYGQTDASQWSGDIISNQLERGARRDFPVSGISFLGGHFPYEGRGDIGHHALMKGEEARAWWPVSPRPLRDHVHMTSAQRGEGG